MTGLRPSEPLTGRLVRIEPIEERHREGLRAAAVDAIERFRWTGLGWLPFDEWFDDTLAAGEEVPFAVIAGGREVGSTRYMAIALEHRRAEIGWTWYDPAVWRTGVNVETKLLLLEHAFERCDLQRVEFKTDARNAQSRGALLALGAQFEGIFRKHQVLPGGPRDSAWYSIVDEEWPAVKERLRRRLAPAG